MVDPETRGLTRLLLKEAEKAKRLGRVPDDATFPLGTKVEGGRVVFPETGVGALLALLGIATGIVSLVFLVGLGAILASRAIQAFLALPVLSTPIALGVAAATSLLCAGALLFAARDIGRWRWVIVMQIVIGVFGGAYGFVSTADTVSAWAIAAAAAVTVANGFEKFWKIRQGQQSSQSSAESEGRTPSTEPASAPIEIRCEHRAPYQVSDVRGGRIISSVSIGIRNSASSPLSNCQVSVERIAPEPPIPGGWPVILDGGGFTLRHDEPEKLVLVATHWNHVDKFRFNAPAAAVGFGEQLMFIEDKEPRTFVLRVAATKHQRSATFRLWTDERRSIHLDWIGYLD
jgi:hypothetical protein